MCGIVGYVGERPAAPILLDGLGKLEYRGYDSSGIAVVHNGIIENYLEIKNSLIRKGVVFSSDTDTEVIVQLLEYYYKKNQT